MKKINKDLDKLESKDLFPEQTKRAVNSLSEVITTKEQADIFKRHLNMLNETKNTSL